MGLFDKLFGGKKSEQPTDTDQGGEVNAPLSADGSQSASDTVAPAVSNNVTISDDGQFTPPPSAVVPETPVADSGSADTTDTNTTEVAAPPAEPTEEAVQPNESNLETSDEPEATDEKTV